MVVQRICSEKNLSIENSPKGIEFSERNVESSFIALQKVETLVDTD